MAETTETSKLTMSEEEAMATARRLCRGYLEHCGMDVVNDGSAGRHRCQGRRRGRARARHRERRRRRARPARAGCE